MAFQVSKTRYNSRTKHYFANPRIKIQVNMTRSLYRNSYLHLIHPWAAVYQSTQTHRHTTVYLTCACTPRHNNTIIIIGCINSVFCQCEHDYYGQSHHLFLIKLLSHLILIFITMIFTVDIIWQLTQIHIYSVKQFENRNFAINLFSWNVPINSSSIQSVTEKFNCYTAKSARGKIR